MSEVGRKAAEIIVGSSTWCSESYASESYYISRSAHPEMEVALKELKIRYDVKDDRIIVSNLPDLAELYDSGADLPGFEGLINGRGP